MNSLAKKDMIIIDGLELCNWDRNLLLELHKGEVTCIHACVGLWENARETLGKIGRWYRFFEENADLIIPVRTGEDILKAKAEGKVGVVLGTQNASPIDDDIALIEVFNNLGLKIMQLTYNNQNLIGSSCYEKTDTGLSRFGKNVVAEMNRVGMLIDLSHCGDQTTLDAIEASRRPVSITHANPDWIYPSRRNKSREVLHALKDNRGMLGLCVYPFLINGAATTMTEFCELVARSVDFMGVEQVALGTDLTLNLDDEFLKWMRMGRWTFEMDYGAGSKDNPSWPAWPAWFQGPADFPNIADGLLAHGFSKQDVYAVMGGNWLNFFTESFKSEKELKVCV
ncbi:membrane dipeptidase [Ammoniphilus sp. CFH 90114]|uniref:membrane dipeptidase n=1 Tax=Ammoniphilus sp. CFH 90114 TaxID=2493665 RepID=UPI00100EC883|nr:membrane dipeptidase [Ammoniphilus sp. CFH 90114]RXT05294.1 membrane dipeptidase [Ammoniphilus sp. CFH 90114]